MPLEVACTCQQSDWLSTHDGLNARVARSPESTVLVHAAALVSEPEPRQFGKEGLAHRPGSGSVHCGMLGILLIAEPCKVCRVFC